MCSLSHRGILYHKAFEKAHEELFAESADADAEAAGGPVGMTASRKRKSKVDNPILAVEIDDYKLTCAQRSDNGTMMSFMMNAEFERFVKGFFLKVIRHVIRGAESVVPHTPLAKFHFQPSDTPNIKDKVVWTVSARAWRASASTQCKGPLVHHDLPVDRTLPPEAFLKAKCEKYWEAVRWWNSTDNSKRHKITLPVGVEG